MIVIGSAINMTNTIVRPLAALYTPFTEGVYA
jgi:hypothetical protein